ncbi:restriction endonuclease [Bacillus sp. X1(2014)]|uniref:restriction endonuclease n=1 Tax=Bacillus sp. X1(2014) TaxID=1565991 RepID=UPI0011A3251C|nr:restriction endonuclease [Bacillus sp. X1(2014)]
MYKKLARPANWQDFERLICALYEKIYGMVTSNLYGRHGQAQDGVDTYFREIPTLGKQNVAIQCKRYEIGQLTTDIIDKEHDKVKNFPNKVDTYIIITTDSTDTALQNYASTKKEPKCELVFWETIESKIQMYEDILQGYYKEFVIYRDPTKEGNTASQYFVLEFSGSRLEFLISRIPTYEGKFSDTGFLLNLQTKKAAYYPVRNKRDLLFVFDTTYDAFAVFHFLEQFNGFSFLANKSIGHAVFLNQQQIQDEVIDYEKRVGI